ncbi:MAG TPA: hypothetical protein DDW17_03405 [Deltaproteobacteria bacterium]|nr:hypothetical protein [Deltaproteobacteria bacterium]
MSTSSINSISHILFKEVIKPLRFTFATALGKKDAMRSMIVRVKLKDGSYGIGECPTSFAFKNETVLTIKKILREASKEIINTPVLFYEEKIKRLRRHYREYPMTISGLEVALFRAYLMNKNISEHVYWGSKVSSLETDITLPFITDRTLLSRWIQYALQKGFHIFKLKVSGIVDQDKQILSHIYPALKDNLSRFILRLDGNQGYTVKTFSRIIQYIEKKGYNIELFEQPLPKDDSKGFKAIKRYSPIPIILDETILTAGDVEYAIDNGLCHGINIKIAKSGLSESLKIFNLAKRHNLTLMIGSMIETMVGASAGIFFASGKGGFNYIDLDSIHFLHHKNRYGNITIDGSWFKIA